MQKCEICQQNNADQIIYSIGKKGEKNTGVCNACLKEYLYESEK